MHQDKRGRERGRAAKQRGESEREVWGTRWWQCKAVGSKSNGMVGMMDSYRQGSDGCAGLLNPQNEALAPWRDRLDEAYADFLVSTGGPTREPGATG